MFVKISKYLQETPVLESLFNKVVKRRIYDGDRTISGLVWTILLTQK